MNSILIGQKQAKIQVPAVWTGEASYNRRFYKVECRDKRIPMVTLYQAIERPHADGLRDSAYVRRDSQHTIAVQITVFPSHLAASDVHLLVGKNEDDFVRILFLPTTGRREGPPEIKHLRVTMKQILAKMEEAARAAEPEIDRLFREEFLEASEVERIPIESEEAAVSADEDKQESHESDED